MMRSCLASIPWWARRSQGQIGYSLSPPPQMGDAFFVEDLDSVPPDSWRHGVVLNVPIDIVKHPELEDATVLLSTEAMEEEANRAANSVNESYYRTGWDIILTMKRLLKPSIWKEK
jgi:hypothetical protein